MKVVGGHVAGCGEYGNDKESDERKRERSEDAALLKRKCSAFTAQTQRFYSAKRSANANQTQHECKANAARMQWKNAQMQHKRSAIALQTQRECMANAALFQRRRSANA
jgi:hypothetical protein